MRENVQYSILFILIAGVVFLACSSQEVVKDSGRQRYIPPEKQQETAEMKDEAEFRVVTKATASMGLKRFQREFYEPQKIEIPDYAADKMGYELQKSINDPSRNIMMVFVKCNQIIDEEIITRLEDNGLLINTYTDDICTVRVQKTDLFNAAKLDVIQFMRLSTRLEPSMKKRGSIYSDI